MNSKEAVSSSLHHPRRNHKLLRPRSRGSCFLLSGSLPDGKRLSGGTGGIEGPKKNKQEPGSGKNQEQDLGLQQFFHHPLSVQHSLRPRIAEGQGSRRRKPGPMRGNGLRWQADGVHVPPVLGSGDLPVTWIITPRPRVNHGAAIPAPEQLRSSGRAPRPPPWPGPCGPPGSRGSGGWSWC